MRLFLALLWLAAQVSAGETADTLTFRNGGGVWPSATPPTLWNEWAWKDEPYDDNGKQKKRRVIGGEDHKNLAWKTELPFWGNGQPLVIGSRIYLLHEMEYWDETQMGPRLVCLDAKDGKILWSKEVNHLDLIPGDRTAVTKVWLEERRWVAAKWRLAWRMHLVTDTDQAALDAIWKEALALGVTKADDKDFGKKISDYGMGDTGRFWKGEPPEAKARRQVLAGANLFNPAWNDLSDNVPGRWMGVTFPTPVSDGKHLFIRTAQHLLACYDLEGKPVWRVLFALKPGYCSYAPSPVLVGGKLVVYSPGGRDRDAVLCRAFDPASGKQIWAVEGKCPDYAIGNPVALNLGGTEVVFLPGGFVLRVSDGRILAQGIGWMAGADNPVAVGDVLYLRNAQDGGGYGGKVPAGISAVRLALAGDTVTATTLWQTEKAGDAGFERGLVAADGLVFGTCKRGVAVLDAATGAVIKTTTAAVGSWNLIVAGNCLISANDNDGRFTVLSADRDLKPLGGGQLDREVKKPADMWHYRNENGEWGVAPATLPIVPMGDRLLVRTWFNLYCLGN